MSIKRWFDFKEHGAKLDRKIGANGSGYLDLLFVDEATMNERLANSRVEIVAQAGWVKPEDRPSIHHYGDFSDFTEISRVLSVVFDDETVEQAITARESLRQGELLEGVDRPIYIDKAHIEQSLKHLPETIRSRAMDMIENARERRLTFRGASLGATGGKLLELAERVSDKLGLPSATSITKLVSIRYDENTIEQIEKLALNPTDTEKNQLDDIMNRIHINEKMLLGFREFSIQAGRNADQVEAVAAAEYFLAQPDARDFVLDLDPPYAETAPPSDGFRGDVHGYTFEVSADTTTLAAREYQARLSKAVVFIAETFGMEPTDVFLQHTRIRVVQGSANPSLRGYQIQTKYSGEDPDEASGAIVFSQGTLGTALHEMCHGLSRRLGNDPAKYDKIIHETGLMEAFDKVLVKAGLGLPFTHK